MKHEHKHHEKHHEHKPHSQFNDNRMVKDDHQQGIGRVLQRGHDKRDYCGHFGAMKDGWKHGKSEKHDSFNRDHGPQVPKKG